MTTPLFSSDMAYMRSAGLMSSTALDRAARVFGPKSWTVRVSETSSRLTLPAPASPPPQPAAPSVIAAASRPADSFFHTVCFIVSLLRFPVRGFPA